MLLLWIICALISLAFLALLGWMDYVDIGVVELHMNEAIIFAFILLMGPLGTFFCIFFCIATVYENKGNTVLFRKERKK